MRTYLIWTAACIAALSAQPASAQLKAGEPPITPLTAQSGGPLIPERAALRLKHLNLAIEVQPDAQSIQGVAELMLHSSAAQRRLLIDLDKNLPVSAIEMDGKALPRPAWSNPDGRLVITPGRTIRAGQTIRLRITYGGTPHIAVRPPWQDGIIWGKTKDGRPWIATTSEGYGCDLIFPCLDFPKGEPELLDFHITVPAGLKAPGNGKFVAMETLPDGRTKWHWRARSPNPYSIALQIGPYAEIADMYESRFGNRIPMNFWHLPENAEKARGLFAEFRPVVDFFEALIGPYPWHDEKIGVVETPHLGMEHQTVNAYGNGYRKTPDGFDELFHHELAHEWFGNQMSAANWDDYWLHEGFASYMQPLYGQWREGEARYAAMMAAIRPQIQNAAPIVSGRELTEEEVYDDAKGGPGGDIYTKGAWVLHTLRNLIGDEAFFQSTRMLVYGRDDPKPGNFQPRFATTDAFISYVNAATGKDMGWFFDVYLKSAALPELKQDSSGNLLKLEWTATGAKPFPMPVEVSVNGVVTKLPMANGKASLELPAGARVVIDPHARILRHSTAMEDYQQDRLSRSR